MPKERILVVDDERGVMRSCVRILERNGYPVTGRTESHTTPDLLRQETFDVLLTDIKMPKLDGLQLLKIAKEIDPHITVVLITGYGTMEDAIRAIQFGAEGFLLKPFEPYELITAVENSLSRRTLLRDSLRLQTLLPLLEINKLMRVSGGEVSLVRRILEIVSQEIGAARLAWLNWPTEPPLPLPEPAELVVIGPPHIPASPLLHQALAQMRQTGQPVWALADGTLVSTHEEYPTVVAATLPLVVHGRVAGAIAAETGSDERSGPFGQISLELLTLVANQLAIIIENMQLFQRAESLRTFNENIIQNITNGLIAVNPAGQVTAINSAATAMLGCQMEAILHKKLAEALPGAGPLVQVFANTLAGKEPQPRTEIEIEQNEGERLPVSISTALLQNNGPESAGAVGVIEDLREIKALEAEHRRLDRLAALGEMAAVVAHEIRNPIAGIGAGVEYLTRNAPEGSMEKEGAVMIQGEIQRVSRILEDILFVARPLMLDKASQPLTPIIETVLQRCQPQITAGKIRVFTRFDDNLPHLNIDSQRLEQVFNNLVINATQALAPDGELDIAVSLETDAPPNRVVVKVMDNGPGIPENILTRIFDPFFTTKTRGTGLGLSVARRIVEAHNGPITVNSAPHQGTTFFIKLPVEENRVS